MNIWLNFLIDSLAFGATFMYGSTGEIISEKAGHLNLGIPGIMCVGGAGGCLLLNIAGNKGLPPFLLVIIGILGSVLLATLCGLIYSFLTISLRANQNVTGLALTTFGVGLMKVIVVKLDPKNYLFGTKEFFRWPFADRTDSLQRLGILFFLAVVVALAASWVLFRTKVGLHLRAVGENPATADAVGINVTRYKYAATLIGCAIAGLGGFYYIIDYMGSQEAYLSVEAFGWLSIALVIFALWRPHMTIIGSIAFGFLFSCTSFITNIPGINVTIKMMPILEMLPYVVTIIVLIITSIRDKKENQPPASLGLSYFREER